MLWTVPPAPVTAAASPPAFTEVLGGPAGGTIWHGVIPGKSAGASGRSSYVYLPPGVSAGRRYPVVYLLHGMPGGPTSYVNSLRLAQEGDRLISQRSIRPFIGVVPPAGPNRGNRSSHYRGEWAGAWEDYLTRDVVPWVDAHLPSIASPGGRTIGGLSAGGYGAVDIALRHPGVFGTVESWSGYFAPFRDGPLQGATKAELAAHDPRLLVHREARRLRRLGVRFELSSGVAHGPIRPALTVRFASELRSLHLLYRLWFVPSRIRTPDYRDQMVHGLLYALRRG